MRTTILALATLMLPSTLAVASTFVRPITSGQLTVAANETGSFSMDVSGPGFSLSTAGGGLGAAVFGFCTLETAGCPFGTTITVNPVVSNPDAVGSLELDGVSYFGAKIDIQAGRLVTDAVTVNGFGAYETNFRLSSSPILTGRFPDEIESPLNVFGVGAAYFTAYASSDDPTMFQIREVDYVFAVPEPASIWLVAIAGLALVAWHARRKGARC